MVDRFDVVLFGPTGVTGREVARYLAHRAPELGLRWAVAGRDRDRIDAALAAVGAEPDAVVLADVSDRSSIDAMVTSTAVVANLVGPYARYGEPVYAACALHGTDQLDLTGETDWLRTMIDRYQAGAVASGARIVPTAGFEALPFDLGALLAAATASERYGEPVVDVDIAVRIEHHGSLAGMADAVSGGTFVSGVELLQRGAGAAFRDPYLLDPPGTVASGRYDLRPRRHSGTRAWLAPVFPSPFLNPPVVHRSAALLRQAGDRTFAPGYRYREGVVTAAMLPGAGGAATAPLLAGSIAGAQVGFGLVARLPGVVRGPIAEGLLRIGPKAGDGPRPETLDDWTYRLDVRARTAGGGTADVVVEAQGHPGYKSTAMLVAEAALALADGSAHDSASPLAAGFLTPATALGLGALDRFGHAGATFRVIG